MLQCCFKSVLYYTESKLAVLWPRGFAHLTTDLGEAGPASPGGKDDYYPKYLCRLHSPSALYELNRRESPPKKHQLMAKFCTWESHMGSLYPAFSQSIRASFITCDKRRRNVEETGQKNKHPLKLFRENSLPCFRYRDIYSSCSVMKSSTTDKQDPNDKWILLTYIIQTTLGEIVAILIICVSNLRNHRD